MSPRRRASRSAILAVLALAIGLAPLESLSAKGKREAGPAPGGAAKRPTVDEKVRGLERKPGLLTLHLDRAAGKVWAEMPPAVASKPGWPLIHVAGLTSGLGSNPVGLDRGLQEGSRLVVFRRVGGKILLEEQNLRFRVLGGPPAEERAVRESFATSVLWGGEIAAEDSDGRVLVDFTPFLASDVLRSGRVFQEAGQGDFTLDPDRSAVDLDSVLVFPDNVEVDAVLTFRGTKPGPLVEETAPTADAVTLIQHQSFVRLPPDGYRPRSFDPRSAANPIFFHDYGAPIEAPYQVRWIERHRLEKTDPAQPRSAAKKPIVYYVDPGIPEPIRGAVLDGARWWEQAFDAAGFKDAYRVEILPEGAHPLDVRYNVIEWVHRSTRGWSYGGSVIDPRTGEILKGHVRLGSLRVRQDRLLFEGLLGTSNSGSGAPDDPVRLALARIRQLAAHEVGHTLGFAHNFAASAAGRASVMDYPAPLVKVDGRGKLDVSQAYATGIGEWDKLALRWSYAQFPPGADESRELEAILREGIARGLIFLGDADARPPGAAQPIANLWDNGPDPVAALRETMRIRRIALERFGEDAVRPGMPLALTQEVFLPVYFHYRYQLDAAVKVLGGIDYVHALRGDGQPPARIVAADRQRQALAALLEILSPRELDISEPILQRLLPRPPDYGANVELIEGRADPAFDAPGAAATAASMVVKALLQPERAARVVDQNRRDPKLPGLGEVLDALVDRGFREEPNAGPRLAQLGAVIRRAVADGMIDLAADPRADPTARAIADQRLPALARRLATPRGGDRTAQVSDAALGADIRRWIDRRPGEAPERTRPANPPPGSPIGSGFGNLLPPSLAGCSAGGD